MPVFCTLFYQNFFGGIVLRTKEINYDFFLEPEKIDLAAEKVEEYLTSLGLKKKEVIRLRLSVEEILLSWKERTDGKRMVQLSCYKRLGQPLIRLKLVGNTCDPLKKTEDTFSEWSETLLSRLETRPVYTYSRGVNIVTFRVLRPKRNPLVLLLIAVASAIIVGALGMFLPAEFRTDIAQHLIEPICTTYLDLMCFYGIPLIFLSVALGITGVGDVHAFGRIGKRMLGHYALFSSFAALGAAILAYPFFAFVFGASSANFSYADVLSMVLGWVPTSLVTPFIECNAMQLIFLGFIFGIGLLKLEPLGHRLLDVFEDVNSILLLAAEWFTRLLPALVFGTIVKSFWLGQLSEILPAWKSWVATTLLQALFFLLMTLAVCRKYKVRLIVLLKKVFSTFLIALGTNSCTASVTDNYAVCAGKLGIDSSVFGFGIPIGTSIFKPACAIRMVVLSFYVVSMYEVSVSPGWFILAILMAILFSVAVPAIPGGVLMFFPMLFAQLGLPAEALTPMLATDIFFDCVCTAFNQVSVQIALIYQAGEMELLDKEMLRSDQQAPVRV